jgi:hypothetical protein
MIHYQLICAGEHQFDGWFKDSAAFDLQAASGLVECPECGGTKVHRALMAPALGRSRKSKRAMVVDQSGQSEAAPSPPAPSAPAIVPSEKAGAVMPDQVRAMFQRLRSEVEKNCEHVGDRFAEEARAIHRGETPARGIYGESTPEQAEALADEGIEVARIPWVPRADG